MMSGSTGKAPLADSRLEAGIEHAPHGLLVQVPAKDTLRNFDASPRLWLAEEPATTEHAVTEYGRGVLEHHHVHRIGAEPAARVGHEIEALAPPCRRIVVGGECHGKIDVRARARMARCPGAKQIDRRDRRVGRPGIRKKANTLVQVLWKRTFGEHARIVRRGSREGNLVHGFTHLLDQAPYSTYRREILGPDPRQGLGSQS